MRRVVAFDVEIVFRLQEKVIPLDDLALLRATGHAQLARRRTDDGPRLEQDQPVFGGGVVRLDPDEVVRHFTMEDTHGLSSLCFAALNHNADEGYEWSFGVRLLRNHAGLAC